MTDIAAVILNYNDSKAVMDLAGTIAGYGSIDRIIVVDNASTDGSAEILICIFVPVITKRPVR